MWALGGWLGYDGIGRVGFGYGLGWEVVFLLRTVLSRVRV